MQPAAAAAIAAVPLPALSLCDVACRRGNRVLLRGVNLEQRAGHATWLRGRNGRGKTSLLRLAAGLASAESGRVLWGGTPLRQAADFARRRVFIGHSNALKDDLSVIEALQFLARLHGRPDDAGALRAALERLGMDKRRDALVRTLSQGQRRRAALARLALERTASLWLLDEPYDALDADGVRAVDALLHAHLGRGGSVLLTSHVAPGDGAPTMTVLDLDAFAAA
ncbi:MAG TPA: heme ABC exporter ATP-binding protein CcmA [Burkholderiaceae bacterium]|nr:heme ABC exporter ATP-binding protein CcmA [Burkholderiaceae bacterium]